MFEYIFTGVLGIFIVVLGVINMMGNISLLHSYHRHRVTEADRPIFGKIVGLGNLIIGVGIIIFSILMAIANGTANHVLTITAVAIMILGIVIGLGISFYAMIKYNKGIF